MQVSPTRVRLPDVVVDHARRWPKVFPHPPLIAIEVLSPSDSYIETERKALEYRQMGVPNIWLINPEDRTGRVCRAEGWLDTTRFTVEGTVIYLDLEWLFSRLNRYDDAQEDSGF
jgi:Uma2 family endonuclease